MWAEPNTGRHIMILYVMILWLLPHCLKFSPHAFYLEEKVEVFAAEALRNPEVNCNHLNQLCNTQKPKSRHAATSITALKLKFVPSDL